MGTQKFNIIGANNLSENSVAKLLRLARQVVCGRCQGTGDRTPTNSREYCHYCMGKGFHSEKKKPFEESSLERTGVK